jgi:hypothetical protein
MWKVYRRQTTDDGRQVMAIVHLDLWSRWTNKIDWLLVASRPSANISCIFMMKTSSTIHNIKWYRNEEGLENPSINANIRGQDQLSINWINVQERKIVFWEQSDLWWFLTWPHLGRCMEVEYAPHMLMM